MLNTTLLINAILILIAMLVTGLLVQQIWLTLRLEDHNQDWLDAIKAVSDELAFLRASASRTDSKATPDSSENDTPGPRA